MLRRLTWVACASVLMAMPGFAGSLCDGTAGNLVLNCGFELDSFADWIQGGNTGFESIQMFAANSGNFGAYLGPEQSTGSLTQVISDSAGFISLDFYLRNTGGPPNSFEVLWNGAPVTTASTPVTDGLPFAYTEQGPVTLTSTGSDTLEFVFRQDPVAWYLDDVTVVQETSTPEPATILLVLAALGLGAVGIRMKATRNAA